MTHFKNDDNQTLLLLEVVFFMTEQIVKVQTNKTCFNWCVWNWGFTKKKKKEKKTGQSRAYALYIGG